MILNRPGKLLTLLMDIPVFRGLEKKDYKLIMPLLVPIKYPDRSVVIRQGDEGDSMYIIKKGSVHVTRKEKNMNEVSLGNLEEGSFFGELSLIDNLPRSATVTCDGECEIFRMSRHDFENLILQNEKIALTFYRNCLNESFSRFRKVVSNFTFSQNILMEKNEELDDINADLWSAQRIQQYFTNINEFDTIVLPENIGHSYIFKPCMAIGGDFLNILTGKKNMTGIIMADVEGKGIQASLGTGVLKSCVSMIYDQLGHNPVKFIRYLNRHFQKIIKELYATCCYCLIDHGKHRMSIIAAGSIYPLYYDTKKTKFIDITCRGTALGVDKKAEYEVFNIAYKPGDKILFFSNGIFSLLDKDGDVYSIEKMKDDFKKHLANKNDNILQGIYNDIISFTGTEDFKDDVTFLLIEF